MNSVPSKLEKTDLDTLYRKNQIKSIGFLIILSCVLLLTILLSLRAGSYETPMKELIKGIFGQSADRKINLVVRSNRLPRILTAVLAGGGLGLAGCVLQAVLRNPLASSSTLGVSQGATFGAAFAIVVLGMGSTTGFGIPLCAFLGSISVALVILGLSKFRQVSPEGIVLAGVAISSMFTGGTALVQYFCDDVMVATVVYWTFGSLGRAGWSEIAIIAAVTLASFAFFYGNRWNYNAMESGTHTAKSLGVPVDRLILLSMILCALISSIAVAFVGCISFIGLIASHIMRRFVGNDYRFLIPCSALCGSVLLLLSDIVSRVLIAPTVLPIGALTSFLGAPLFLYLIVKGGKRK